MHSLESVALANREYVAEQYRRWKADPEAVGSEWSLFFAGFEMGAEANGAAPGPASSPAFGVFDLVHSYRELGHLVATLNPLDAAPRSHPLLDPSEFGFGDDDMGRVVSCGGFRGCSRATIA